MTTFKADLAAETLQPESNPGQNPYLLTARQMAQFVTDGFLMVEHLVPDELNRQVLEDERRWTDSNYHFWSKSEAVREVFNLPQVKGILEGFLGPRPIYDHSYLHFVKAHNHKAQNWHADSVIDSRPFGFDIQAFYFSHDAPKEMGPTLVLPGSHMRKTNTSSIGRYRNFIGQRQLATTAGTIVFFHHGLWHCAQPNFTGTDRYVFKLRLRPCQPQRGLFNMAGYTSPEVTDIIENGYQVWQGNEDRLEHIQRGKLWRYVTGDDSVDVSFEGSLTRMGL